MLPTHPSICLEWKVENEFESLSKNTGGRLGWGEKVPEVIPHDSHLSPKDEHTDGCTQKAMAELAYTDSTTGMYIVSSS